MVGTLTQFQQRHSKYQRRENDAQQVLIGQCTNDILRHDIEHDLHKAWIIRRMGISKSVYGFSLPLGATLNMDGAAIRIAISAVFAANVIGAPLDLLSMMQVVLIGTLVSVGTAGVPGAGIIMIASVFAQVGLPIETVVLLTAIDALVGMGATGLNVTGDLVGSAVIARSEGETLADEAPLDDEHPATS